ncbi:MAG: NAD(P)-dependent glycerol-3-phosphate dehydrogenase [Anaerolineae bacterium]|jgi:glycerol-3-phosphate dehydrogenase (NAD(P)+)|nr:NAD(P)-dependent glycerol-3-phosphate dehydrogenase [Anaerolineae bacterium]
MRVVVLGAGSWGTALAILLARNGAEVHLAGRDLDEIDTMRLRRENARYLPGFALPAEVRVIPLADSPADADLAVIAVPAKAVREICAFVAPSATILVSSKGLEAGSGAILTEVVAEAVPGAEVGVISGPNLAVELVRGIPTVAVVAFPREETAERVRGAFMSRTYRVYIGSDIVGVELAGALKNVLAIGAGMIDGLGYGDNTKGAMLARGLHEMACLGVHMGARLETFFGIAGVGDLFATANSRLSRNYRVGLGLGEGKPLARVLESIGQVAEGVPTSEAAVMLAKRHHVETPIFEAVHGVLREHLRPLEAVDRLMERMPKHESFAMECPS